MPNLEPSIYVLMVKILVEHVRIGKIVVRIIKISKCAVRGGNQQGCRKFKSCARKCMRVLKSISLKKIIKIYFACAWPSSWWIIFLVKKCIIIWHYDESNSKLVNVQI